MKTIAIMDTSIMSFNLGDQIIMESARKGLEKITRNAFVVTMPTHSPLFHKYEFSFRKIDSFRAALNKIDYKFVCGTNLLEKNMKKRKTSWNLNIFDLDYISNFILVGVGSDGLVGVQNKYTECFYQKALSQDYYHSTRDEKTRLFLESIGIKAINTGCVTLWPLTKKHCEKIPSAKSDTVIFTITDYMTDAKSDKKFINILLKNYKNIYFWIQGLNDFSYIESLTISEFNERIKIIPPSLNAYSEFLETHETDYVGTRLHAGIKAMQAGKRSIILGVDNRAKDLNDTYNINYLSREKVDELHDMISENFVTKININIENITKFLEQFYE